MALDPRIALMGTQWQAPDFQGAMRQGQEYRKNQMAERRAAQVEQVLQNYFASQAAPPAAPPPVAAPAMQPGSSGSPITGAPLPSVNAMGASMGAPTPAATPARAPRNIDPLLMIADDPRAAAIIAKNARDDAAAAAAVTAGRQADEATRDATNFTEGYIAQSASRIASANGDPAAVARELRWLRSIPGVNPVIVDGLETLVADMPPEELAGYTRNYALQYTGSRAAAQDLDPNMVSESTGAERYYRQMNPRGERYGETSFSTPQVLSPAAEAADRRSSEENAREDARNLQRRWDAYDDAVARHTRWVESAEGPQQRAQRAQALVPRPPAEPRPGGGGGNAPAAPRPAASDKGRPPPAPPAGTAPGTTQPNLRTGVTWTWDGSQWQ
jgi:hypothetical protein